MPTEELPLEELQVLDHDLVERRLAMNHIREDTGPEPQELAAREPAQGLCQNAHCALVGLWREFRDCGYTGVEDDALTDSLAIKVELEVRVLSQVTGHGTGKLVLCDWVWLRVRGCLI